MDDFLKSKNWKLIGNFLKRKELTPLWCVLGSAIIGAFIPNLGLLTLGGTIGWYIAKFTDTRKGE